jgi:hypothetical protein
MFTQHRRQQMRHLMNPLGNFNQALRVN